MEQNINGKAEVSHVAKALDLGMLYRSFELDR